MHAHCGQNKRAGKVQRVRNKTFAARCNARHYAPEGALAVLPLPSLVASKYLPARFAAEAVPCLTFFVLSLFLCLR
jgi:hypothetical protein